MIGVHHGRLVRIVRPHVVQYGFEFLDLLVGDRNRGERHRLALEQDARLGQVEGAHVEVERIGTLAAAMVAARDIEARAVPRLDPALHLERDHRLADRRPADLVFLGQVALARQPAARRPAPGLDRLGDRSGHPLIELVAGNLHRTLIVTLPRRLTR